MKILHIIDQISQKTAGGSAKVCYQLAEEQARQGNEVSIYTSDYNLNGQFVPPEGVKVKTFRCALNLLGGIRITPGLLMCNWEKFHVMHLHNYRTFLNIVTTWFDIPWVLQAHGSASPL